MGTALLQRKLNADECGIYYTEKKNLGIGFNDCIPDSILTKIILIMSLSHTHIHKITGT